MIRENTHAASYGDLNVTSGTLHDLIFVLINVTINERVIRVLDVLLLFHFFEGFIRPQYDFQ